jgi:hypothetical protein
MMFDDSGRHVLTAPFDESNADYQEYLAWVAEGNEPLHAPSAEITAGS